MHILNHPTDSRELDKDQDTHHIWFETLNYLFKNGSEGLRNDIDHLMGGGVRTVVEMADIVKKHLVQANQPRHEGCAIPYSRAMFYRYETAYVLDDRIMSKTFNQHEIWCYSRHFGWEAVEAITNAGTPAKSYYDETLGITRSMTGCHTVQTKEALDKLVNAYDMDIEVSAPVFIILATPDAEQPGHSKGLGLILCNNTKEMTYQSSLSLYQEEMGSVVEFGRSHNLTKHDMVFRMNARTKAVNV